MVTLTELSALNLALWYGVPYAALFMVWLLLAPVQLALLHRRPGFTRHDWGLALGAFCFWIASNTNPLLLSPLSFFALLLIRTRMLEIRAGAARHAEQAQQTPFWMDGPHGAR
jgi:hypothetical protein